MSASAELSSIVFINNPNANPARFAAYSVDRLGNGSYQKSIRSHYIMPGDSDSVVFQEDTVGLRHFTFGLNCLYQDVDYTVQVSIGGIWCNVTDHVNVTLTADAAPVLDIVEIEAEAIRVLAHNNVGGNDGGIRVMLVASS